MTHLPLTEIALAAMARGDTNETPDPLLLPTVTGARGHQAHGEVPMRTSIMAIGMTAIFVAMPAGAKTTPSPVSVQPQPQQNGVIAGEMHQRNETNTVFTDTYEQANTSNYLDKSQHDTTQNFVKEIGRAHV